MRLGRTGKMTALISKIVLPKRMINHPRFSLILSKMGKIIKTKEVMDIVIFACQ